MDTKRDNPYASPVSPPPETQVKPRHSRRLSTALLFSFEAWLGSAMTLLLLWEILSQQGLVVRGSLPILFGFFCLASAPIAVAMSVWVWREPESSWPSFTANTLGIVPFAVAVLAVLLGFFN